MAGPACPTSIKTRLPRRTKKSYTPASALIHCLRTYVTTLLRKMFFQYSSHGSGINSRQQFTFRRVKTMDNLPEGPRWSTLGNPYDIGDEKCCSCADTVSVCDASPTT